MIHMYKKKDHFLPIENSKSNMEFHGSYYCEYYIRYFGDKEKTLFYEKPKRKMFKRHFDSQLIWIPNKLCKWMGKTQPKRF